MNTFRKGLDVVLGSVCCLVLAIMVGISCWQVISRYILGVPSTITEEMLRFLLVWVSMLGMAYVAGKKQHISLTILLDKVSPALGIPMGKVYYALPCAGVLIILYGLLNIAESLKAPHSASNVSESALEKSHD
ncbi:TRAP transporter small permease [Citrobacter sp. RHB25-C09]|uniref:TRAP transporter small permease n=1 Tax=Citrobacter sp. RHB25-C09 TaxID=2742624 RepID=UPI0015EF9BA0|nr:TRAP transporter small permease [Citrobacter sp. RHB25-C09]QMI06950.1 TRAP transporter small permease [Citrobacter sp. RHB25-C09]